MKHAKVEEEFGQPQLKMQSPSKTLKMRVVSIDAQENIALKHKGWPSEGDLLSFHSDRGNEESKKAIEQQINMNNQPSPHTLQSPFII